MPKRTGGQLAIRRVGVLGSVLVFLLLRRRMVIRFVCSFSRSEGAKRETYELSNCFCRRVIESLRSNSGRCNRCLFNRLLFVFRSLIIYEQLDIYRSWVGDVAGPFAPAIGFDQHVVAQRIRRGDWACAAGQTRRPTTLAAPTAGDRKQRNEMQTKQPRQRIRWPEFSSKDHRINNRFLTFATESAACAEDSDTEPARLRGGTAGEVCGVGLTQFWPSGPLSNCN